MKEQFVTDLNVKDDVDSFFLVKHIAVMEAKDGKNYLNVVLADSTGDLESRKWHNAQEVADVVTRGDYVRATGKINHFQGRLQLIIQTISKIDHREIDKSDFTPKSTSNADLMMEELLKYVADLDDVYIRDLLQIILFDTDIARRLKCWYAGKNIHHAYESGLLEHILSCTRLAAHLSSVYKVNHNYVIAGAVLHDLCKIYELSEGPLVDYTDEGKLIGHLIKASEIVDHFASKIRGFPASIKVHLKHIIISHHGEIEYGSPKVPQTAEAYLVHLIDMMDSKMNSVAKAISTDRTIGRWTGMIKHLDCVLYKHELPTHTEYLPEPESKVPNVQKSSEVRGNAGDKAPEKMSEKNEAHERPEGKSKTKPEKKKDGALTYTMARMLEGLKENQSSDEE
ncbi:MAG: HD domain-containing protein [Bdellovibrio sp.]|nr:HD domain-containing protein [Bdellovibrio sp.]